MPAVVLFETKNRMSELVDRVIAGEVIKITRRGKVVARLAPPEDAAQRRRSTDDAVARPERARRAFGRERLKSLDLIRDGRR